jgi:hypothetical protein
VSARKLRETYPEEELRKMAVPSRYVAAADAEWFLVVEAAPSRPVGELLRGVSPVDVVGATVKFVESVGGFFGHVLVLLLPLAVALIAGLTQVYEDDPFGTWGDYMSAFLVGLGTQAAIQALLGGVSQLRRPLAS